ncbi:hypothetical protein FRC09_001240 [Ceratobasidium sp. 395]|nr:hypothetical protein FRC09_001240 [Ceratobasidium sp. 395]
MIPQPLWPAPGETRTVEDPTLKYLNMALMAREDCQVLRELNELRATGWQSGAIHEHFEHFRRNQNDPNKQDNYDQFWSDRLYKDISHMDLKGRFVRANRFLDIGCCPGGYSTYVMRVCPKATGMGISLPVEDGGHGVAISEDLLPRIDLVMHNLMAYDLSSPNLNNPTNTSLSALPFKPHTFDFVICGASYLRSSPESIRRPWNWNRLQISQLLLGLRAVSAGGTMFIRLSHVERPLTARILLALCRVSNYVRTIKSKIIHSSRGSFYVLAQGVRTGSQEFKELVAGLERLWCVLNFEGRDGLGREITWEEQDCVTPWNEVMSPRGVLCIVRLGTKVWQIQRDGLRELLKWKGVNTSVSWRKRGVVEVAGGGCESVATKA